MSDVVKSANANISFAQLMSNPQQERCDKVLKAFLHGMRKEGIPRAMRIRTLFEFFFYELGQTGDGTGFPSEIEHIENIAIIEEVDERWRRLHGNLKAAWPDLFSPHG